MAAAAPPATVEQSLLGVRETIRSHMRIKRPVIIVLMGLDLLMAVVFVLLPDDRVNDGVSGLGGITEDSVETVDAGLLLSQYLAGVATVIFSAVTLGLSIAPVKEGRPVTWYVVVAMKIAELLFDLMNSTYPRGARFVVIWIEMAIRLVELVFIWRVIRVYDKFSPSMERDWKESSRVKGLSTSHLSAFTNNMEYLVELQSVRTKMKRKMKTGQTAFCVYACVIFLLSFGNFAFEFKKTISVSDEFFTSEFIDPMNEVASVEATFGPNRTSAEYKAIIIVLDGLSNTGFNGQYFQDFLETIESDSVVFPVLAELPTMSVPNWLCIVTGVKPELTGVWGNLMVPETKYDSLFRQARLFDINRGITASAWYTNLIRGQLPLLCGDGTVNLAYDPAQTGHRTNDPVDAKRGEVLLRAVKTQEDPYGFFLGHFSDIDFQGHYYGAAPEYNAQNSYNLAILNKTKILTKMIDALDNNTLVLMGADHGMMPRGGHGGANEVINTTWVAYMKGSGLRTRAAAQPTFGHAQWQMTDIAPSVAAILGLPVPRQCQGVFIDPVMGLVEGSRRTKHFRDLYLQKKAFVRAYLQRTHQENAVTDQALLTESFTGNADEYVTRAKSLQQLYAESRMNQLTAETVRNVLVTLVITLMLSIITFFILQRFSFADPLVITSRKTEAEQLGKRENTIAFFWALGGMAAYYATMIALFKILYAIYGFPSIWDSTMLHSPESVITWAIYVLLPGSILTFALVRSYNCKYSEWPSQELKTENPKQYYLHYTRALLTNSGVAYTDLGMVYLVKYYLLALVVVGLLALFVFQASYTFIVPNIFRIKYIEPIAWGYRFRVITVQLMALPLVAGALLQYYSWPSHEPDVNDFDNVNRLLLRKLRRSGKMDQPDFDRLDSLLLPERTEVFNRMTPMDLFANPLECAQGAPKAVGFLAALENVAAPGQSKFQDMYARVLRRRRQEEDDGMLP